MDGASSTDGKAPASIETAASWRTAWFVLAILTIAYGSPLLLVVGLKPIQEALNTDRSFVSLIIALVWIGTGLGGILMGWLADRIGIRATVAFGVCMTAAGLALASLGSIWALLVGHILLGFLGNSAIHPPLLIYISRWFDRRRGTAIALISSGQYFAGVVWPALFERAFSNIGWQALMMAYGVLVLVILLPATLLLKPVPAPPQFVSDATTPERKLGGMRPNVVQVLMCTAAFFCCIPMALPQAHLVAFCTDIGISPARGATMLSVMLAAAFLARQAWGALADRIGGLGTVLAGSILQALAIVAFSLTQDEAGLFVVAAAYGLGFAGIIPAYAVAVRDVFPSSEASWRMPLTLFAGMSGMAVGSWLAGALYDQFGTYAPAFMTGIIFNIANVLLVGFLVLRLPRARP
jgi:MFS family permease